MRKTIILFIVFCGFTMGARGQTIDLSGFPQETTASQLRYWFNNDVNIQTTSTLSGSTTIDASALVSGIHIVHYQVIDNLGIAGISASKLFFKLGESSATAASLHYWFDSDSKSVKSTDIASGTSAIDASVLVEGIHTIHYQVVDNKGIAGITASKIFFKAGESSTTAASLHYWFDSDVKGVKTTDIASGATTIDAAALVEGIHTIHYQVVDNHGVAGIPVSRMFMKVSAKTITATAIQYWFDENDALIKESAITNLSTAIDASSVGQGEHTLHYQLKFSDGTLSPSSSATFETTQTLEGDANNDQKVNVADIVVIQVFVDDNTKFIHGANADVTGDGIIDKNDVEAVKDMIITPKE